MIALDPLEIEARIELVQRILKWVHDATHELPFGYLGDPQEDVASLCEAANIVGALPREIADPLRAEISAARAIVESYLAYCTANSELSYREWLVAQDHPIRNHWPRYV